jgi:hypothetical protein
LLKKAHNVICDAGFCRLPIIRAQVATNRLVQKVLDRDEIRIAFAVLLANAHGRRLATVCAVAASREETWAHERRRCAL